MTDNATPKDVTQPESSPNRPATRWRRRIALGFGALVSLFLLVLLLPIAFELVFGPTADDFTNVTYSADDGTTLHGYLAQPEGDLNLYPAVLMVHEWWGMNHEITEMADILAQQGYVVLAPDTYRGATTSQVPRAIALRVSVPTDRVDSDMQAAFDYLANLDNVDPNRIAVMGFCYGGGVALRHAVNNPDIAATINLYGDTISDPTQFGALLNDDAGPVFGVFGMEDQQIPVSEVIAFEEALVEAGIESRVTLYDNVGHAFIQPDNIGEEGSPRRAWRDILAFLDENL